MEEKRPYEELKFYQDICEIRKFVFMVTSQFKKANLRLVSQMRDAARSAKQNIREGYRKGSIGEFMNGIRISKGSLEELAGDVEDCKDDDLITADEFNKISELCRSANYMSNQYLKALYKIKEEGSWTVPGKQ